MHAYSMKDPVFFTSMKDERDNNYPHGERFCIQCHSPPALVTENLFDIEEYTSVGEFLSSNVSQVIKEGVSWVDSTVMGMGRGAGNAQTELLLLELDKFKNNFSYYSSYRIFPGQKFAFSNLGLNGMWIKF